jgi:alpha-N-acetylglucosamine transferase
MGSKFRPDRKRVRTTQSLLLKSHCYLVVMMRLFLFNFKKRIDVYITAQPLPENYHGQF